VASRAVGGPPGQRRRLFRRQGSAARDLRVHCLSFCSALTRHLPELRKVIPELKTSHNRIDWILGNLEKVLGDLPADLATAGRVRAELEGPSVIMETHFIYEEMKLPSVLNSMDVPQCADRPDFLLTEEDDSGRVRPR
jgi:hypothetical protein